MPKKPLPADKVAPAILHVMSCLLTELQQAGVIRAEDVIEKCQQGAAAHRAKGDPHGLADAIHAVTEYLMTTVPDDPPRAGR